MILTFSSLENNSKLFLNNQNSWLIIAALYLPQTLFVNLRFVILGTLRSFDAWKFQHFSFCFSLKT